MEDPVHHVLSEGKGVGTPRRSWVIRTGWMGHMAANRDCCGFATIQLSPPERASRKQKVGAPLEDRTQTPSCIGAQDSRLRLQHEGDDKEQHEDDDSAYHKIHHLVHRFPPSWARK
jgi:hypothetical protein